MSRQNHHPPHIYLDDTWYMITGAIYQKKRLLQTQGHRDLVCDRLKSLVGEFAIQLDAWVVLDNHYHLLLKSRIGNDLTHFFGRLHGRTSFELNGLDNTRGRQVWHNYWDNCIRGENDYWKRFNYVHHNPVKHGYVPQTDDWPFSSYHHYIENKGKEWLMDAFCKYPIVDFTDPDDEF